MADHPLVPPTPLVAVTGRLACLSMALLIVSVSPPTPPPIAPPPPTPLSPLTLSLSLLLLDDESSSSLEGVRGGSREGVAKCEGVWSVKCEVCGGVEMGLSLSSLSELEELEKLSDTEVVSAYTRNTVCNLSEMALIGVHLMVYLMDPNRCHLELTW